MIHELKTWPVYFERLADGSKTFEIRRDDRGYQAGDELLLREWDPGTSCDCADVEGCSRNWRRKPPLRFRVGFVAKGDLFGLDLGGHAVLSLIPLPYGPEDAS